MGKTREGVELVLKLWSEAKVDYDGRFYKVSAALCRGSYSGQVQVRQSANYRNLPEILKVLITVN